MTDPRIVLAEKLYGWEWQRDVDMPEGWTHGQWLSPDRGWLPRGDKRNMTPDPANNAADCESLIRKLNEEGWLTEVTFGTASGCDNVKLISIKDSTVTHTLLIVEWKAGVVELAMKIVTGEKKP